MDDGDVEFIRLIAYVFALISGVAAVALWHNRDDFKREVELMTGGQDDERAIKRHRR